jgi:hypothetical protein
VQYFLKRWRLALVAMIAAFAVSVAFAGAANATSGEPGENNFWTHETINNDALNLQTQTTVGEARYDNGNELRVWRGNTPTQNTDGSPRADQVWAAYQQAQTTTGGFPVQAGRTPASTYLAPSAVTWTDPNNGHQSFMVFHVGTDRHIYYTWYDPSVNIWSIAGWQQVPNQTTNAAVGVTQIAGSGIYMVYHSDSDNRFWGTQFNGTFGSSAAWSPPIVIGNGAQGFGAPSIAWNRAGHMLAAIRGLDNNLYLGIANSNGVGGYFWSNFGRQPVQTYNGVTVAYNPGSAAYLVSYIATDGVPTYGVFDYGLNPRCTFSTDITGWRTNVATTLIAIGVAFYVVFTGQDNNAYFKQAWNGQFPTS